MDEKALFCARTTRYNLWITKQGLVFDSIRKVETTHSAPSGHPSQEESKGLPHSPYSPDSPKINRDVSRLLFLKANKNPIITPVEPAQHRVNYFKGNDKSKWHSRIPTSHAVCYKNIYKNIDLKVYGVEKQIEYDWVVKPGGNPGDIRFQYREVKEDSSDEQGNLVVQTAFGKWVHKKPSAYQEIDKAQAADRTDRRIAVDVKFKKTGENTYGFVVGEYDKSCELIIDPLVVAFSTYLGGSLNEELFDIAVDGTGALIAVGYTYSTNFPTSGAYQGILAGPSDSFISKFSPDGSSLAFSTYLGGNGDDGILSILLSAVGQARIIRILKPSVFWPQPQVDSAMVEFVRQQEKLKSIKNVDLFIETVNLFMGHRRKTLTACSRLATGKLEKIGDIKGISWPEIFKQCHIVPAKRPEQLSSEDYIAISNMCFGVLAKA